MAKKAKATVDQSAIDIGAAQEKRATALAIMIDSDVSVIISDLAEHKREYQGGPFVVMDRVVNLLADKDYDLDELPEPHSKTGNNPAHYKIKTTTAKGVSFKDVYFYDELALRLPSVMALVARRDMLTRSLASDKSKVKTDDIPAEVLNRMPHSRMAEIDRINQQVTVAKSNVSTAFELYHQLKKFQELDKVEVVISYALDDNGQLCDGEDGRPFKVEKINSPIMVRSTIKGREDIDKGRYSVGSFLKFDVDKAREAQGGATFSALENTLSKAPKTPDTPTGQIAVNTLQTFVTVLNHESEYLHRILEANDKASWEALKKLAGKEDQEGKDFLYNICYLVANLRPIADDPRNQVTFQKMVDARDKKTVKAA